MEIILGNICYPKSEALIIPGNTKGVMSRGIPARIINDGHSSIFKEAKEFITNNKVDVTDCFITGPGRLKRRGLKVIYHAIIKRLQSDFSSIYVINKALDQALKRVIKDKIKTVAICGLGIDDANLDPKTIARIVIENCNKYNDEVKIKIIDDNKEFIKEMNRLMKELINVSTK